VLEIEVGQLGGELFEPFGVVDVLAQLGGLIRRHAATHIAAILPHLVFEVGANSLGCFTVFAGSLAPFLGQSAWQHGGDVSDLAQEDAASGFGRMG